MIQPFRVRADVVLRKLMGGLHHFLQVCLGVVVSSFSCFRHGLVYVHVFLNRAVFVFGKSHPTIVLVWNGTGFDRFAIGGKAQNIETN